MLVAHLEMGRVVPAHTSDAQTVIQDEMMFAVEVWAIHITPCSSPVERGCAKSHTVSPGQNRTHNNNITLPGHSFYTEKRHLRCD